MGAEQLMVDWGKWGDALYDGAGNLVDKGKEIVGTGIDKGTDVLGAGLEKVGADEWADEVEDWGDETASALGANVGEQQLGQTEEADELIHGRPEKISAAVKNLRDFQKAFDLVGSGMKKLDSGRWKGEAADTLPRQVPDTAHRLGARGGRVRGRGQGVGDVRGDGYQGAGQGR
ncbi:putative T7SS-secreted protein [Streptomyces sp. JH34]|uniref:putative T7SS-secreted protein n=1 Tax=Streptomyces sp. JH34 TaxID=2793633 RepID=UPI003211D5AA|nr:hypothetical protein [Streptomyces sp. JH34]